jgi:hypothetical protein
MNAIQLSNKLQTTGLERESAEVIAQAIDERNQEASTKNDLKLMSRALINPLNQLRNGCILSLPLAALRSDISSLKFKTPLNF